MTLPANKWTVPSLEVSKSLPLKARLFAYIGLHDTLCSEPCSLVRRNSVDAAEFVYSGLGGDVTLRLDIEIDPAGNVTGFDLAGLTAASDLPMLVDLRFDTRDTANPLIGLTHCLFHIVELRAADILAALNDPYLLAG
ncbi:hypothetical protein MBELCI_2649 [Limimaricola cinnabarinus LL-001]|uniref:Uncharacterized protein n=1 Tax=Limimaricola cinnabarinus LL-001 TaxID=1337093 RepID=U2Z697_9RHOB|nr:hypothetical protein MBELCI_2649 [Limimaricola cinnabarinus LL-001]